MINPVVSFNYMLAGYAAIFIVQALYLTSLAVRWKNLKRDLQTLNEIRNQQ